MQQDFIFIKIIINNNNNYYQLFLSNKYISALYLMLCNTPDIVGLHVQ